MLNSSPALAPATTILAGAVLLGTISPRIAAAHECDAARGPLEICPCDRYGNAIPRIAESTTWVFAGGGLEERRGFSPSPAILGIGAEVTIGPLARYRGFPSSAWDPGDAEVRAGVWAVGATHFDGRTLVEGGVKAHLGAINTAEWGTFDVRLGAGYGAFDAKKSPFFVTTFTWGVRSFQQRYGLCGPGSHNLPKAHGYGSVIRAFVTLRRATNAEPNVEFTVGIELSPTFLLPPYSWFRLGGGPA